MRRDWRPLAAFTAAGILVACGRSGTVGEYSSGPGPSPVVLQDTSPGQLTVSVVMSIGGYDAATRDRTLIDVLFRHGGLPVAFIAGEQVTCAGIAMKAFTGSFENAVPTSSVAGKTVTCIYTYGRQSAPFSFKVPAGIIILAPQERQRVPRAVGTRISFTGGVDNTLWVVAISPNMKAVAKPGDITPTSAQLDTSVLSAGQGSIALTDPNSIPVAEIQAGQFQSVTASARRMASVSVVWT